MNDNPFVCQSCHVGKLGMRKTTYTQVFERRLIVIHNVSALVCDMCGERVFDSEVLSRLSGLLGTARAAIRPIGGQL